MRCRQRRLGKLFPFLHSFHSILKIRNVVTQLINLAFQILLILFQLIDPIFNCRLLRVAVPIVLCRQVAGACKRQRKQCDSKNLSSHSSVLINSNTGATDR
jgi:hypothetical protein